jgi:hypothetical protein
MYGLARPFLFHMDPERARGLGLSRKRFDHFGIRDFRKDVDQ